jgi:hypothetical protein
VSWWAWLLAGTAVGALVTMQLLRELALYRRVRRRGGMLEFTPFAGVREETRRR